MIDILGRVGGEEFCIIFATGEAERIEDKIELFRQYIENHNVIYEETQINITSSFGITCFRKYMTNANELVKTADDILYKAKREGENNLCVKITES